MSSFGSYNHKNIEDRIYKYWEKTSVLNQKKTNQKKHILL